MKFTIFFIVMFLLLPSRSTAAQARRLNDTNHWTPRVFVHMRNSIGEILTIHCWSKDDDLGFHNLWTRESWTFSFHLDLLFRTKFTRNFRWPGQSHDFPIYKQLRDLIYKESSWEIRPNGPCYYEIFTIKERCLSWNNVLEKPSSM